ncbi:MAG: hypothetical protein II444_04215 [Firmicutes bacterium]|nr:hypothetical protein [Bacillota bacterium]
MNLTDFYNELDKISERIADAMTVDAAGDIEDQKAREIAISYIKSTAEKQLEDTKRYIRAFRDFK